MYVLSQRFSCEITEVYDDVILKVMFIEHLLCTPYFLSALHMPLILIITTLLVNYPY